MEATQIFVRINSVILVQFAALKHVFIPQIYKGDPRPSTLPHVMGLASAMRLKLGIFGFLPTPHPQKEMRPWSLHTMQPFMHVCLQAQTTVDAGNIRT